MPAPKSHLSDRNGWEHRAPACETFLDEHQLAKRHGVSVKTLRNQRLRGGQSTIPFVKLGKRLVRYRLSDIEAWEQAHLRHSTSDVGGDNG